jgi:para-aminobenzoate synthetase component 1
MPHVNIEQIPYFTHAEKLLGLFLDMPHLALLDSGKPDSLQGQFDILSAAPPVLIKTDSSAVEIIKGESSEYSQSDPIELIKSLVDSICDGEYQLDPKIGQLPFVGGAIGLFSYDLVRLFEKLPELASEDIPTPLMQVGIYDWCIIQNHSTKTSWLVSQPACRQETIDNIQARLSYKKIPMLDEKQFSINGPFTSNLSQINYQRAFDKIQDYIHRGDCYQVNLAQRFSASCNGSSYTAYCKIRKKAPSPFGAYLDLGDAQVLSFSPERFIYTENGHVESKPIKGTRPRSADSGSDQALMQQLAASEKDRAENLMIVDLLRNDLGKSCIPGSIRVDKLFDIESFPNVHHLVSTISGSLEPKLTALDLFKGCFPGGSITGAPKIRAMEIIDELEINRRGIYCGSIAYLSAHGRFDSNIAIRTLLREGSKIHCWGGGGIVADSVCSSEYQESLDKIENLMQALTGKVSGLDTYR